MLADEHLSRRHQYGLMFVGHGDQQGVHRHRRFTRADIGLQQPLHGTVAGQVADLNLRVVLALNELNLPAALARGVLAAATQDYIDNVAPLYPDDWLTLVRSAQSISTDRIADYVAALTADGTLSPVASSPQTR